MSNRCYLLDLPNYGFNSFMKNQKQEDIPTAIASIHYFFFEIVCRCLYTLHFHYVNSPLQHHEKTCDLINRVLLVIAYVRVDAEPPRQSQDVLCDFNASVVLLNFGSVNREGRQ